MQVQTASGKELLGFIETYAGRKILPNLALPICLSFINSICRTSTKAKQHKAGTTCTKQANRYFFHGGLLSCLASNAQQFSWNATVRFWPLSVNFLDFLSYHDSKRKCCRNAHPDAKSESQSRTVQGNSECSSGTGPDASTKY